MNEDKIKKNISDVRKKAVAVEQAISDSQKRKKAEQSRPDLSENYFNDIIESGSTAVRAALILKDYATAQRYGKEMHLLSEEQKARLLLSFETEEDNAVLKETTKIYEGAVEYGRFIVGLRAQWQRAVGEMAVLLTRWKAADDMAEGMTTALHSILSILLQEGTDVKYPTGESVRANINPIIESFKSNFEESVEGSPYKVSFNYDSETQKFEADIDSGGLYSAIMEKQEQAIYQLRMLKGAVEPFSDFLYSEIEFANGEKSLPLWFIPEVVERMVEYPDAVDFDSSPSNKQFFQYMLLRRKDNGETITPTDEKKAVIPDYNQVTEMERQRKNCTIKLINIFKELYQVDGKGTK